MTETENTEPVLTQDEQDVVRRFQVAVGDAGVQSRLMSEALRCADAGTAKSAMRNFDLALEDVVECDLGMMENAGMSFKIVVDMARSARIFPPDFMPSEETVERCLKGFWEGRRREADSDV